MGLRLACEYWALPLVLLVPQLRASVLISQVSSWLPVKQIVHWCSSWLNFWPLFQNYFPWDYPETHCGREGWEWGKEFPHWYTASRATEMFKRVEWDDLSLWWPSRVHLNNCSLESVEGLWNLVWKYFLLVSLDLTATLPPSHPPPRISCSGEPRSPVQREHYFNLALSPWDSAWYLYWQWWEEEKNSALAGFYSACHVYHHWSSLEEDVRKDKQDVNLSLLWGGCLDCERSPWLSLEGTFQTAGQGHFIA